ncbi:TPA: EAL domain-containing protein [Enterobacter cancerogenus]|uniref:EAL domain-containing protein n=1 Tax=Enterobacter cancerogenus TaxID=69218 RepID=UPI001299D96A|nr:EAL domain-containing protein [Enterobacter cancerogenus]MRG34121.1 EAL domain-containing protein [Enterobacter cancerogenus]QZY39538.1 EAL domain-containing protein [Enterobacter cancerogenus]
MAQKSTFFKLAFSFISGAAIAGSITALSWQQIYHSKNVEKNRQAFNAISEIDKLLDDASKALTLASSLTPRNCNPAMRRRLSKIVLGIERIRVINIYRDDILVCSSYDTEKRGASRPDFSNSRLEMLRDSYFTSGTSVMVLRKFSDGYLITSSLSTQWSSMILNVLSDNNSLSLRIGNKFLNNSNKLSNYEGISDSKTEVASKRYPYSIIYSSLNENSPSWYFRMSWFTLFLSLIIGVLGGALTWVILFRQKTVYEKLNAAIKNGNIQPWYQPIYNYSTGQISGVEVLARWVNNNGRVLSPDEFIPIAERTELIISLTRSIMDSSLQELSMLVPANESWTVGINFTRQHISEPGFVTECINYVESFVNQNITLVAELTEREPFDNSELLLNRVKSLSSNGIQIALDDFGTGYANLNHLNKLCIDIVKIDRSFISKIDNPESAHLLEEIIRLSRNLNLKIVAEGVETEEQAAWLNHRKVILQQGYLYSAPIPVDKFKEMLNNPS